jgi:hypothetical protein
LRALVKTVMNSLVSQNVAKLLSGWATDGFSRSSVNMCFRAYVHNDKHSLRMQLCSLQHCWSHTDAEFSKGYSNFCIVFTPKLIILGRWYFPLQCRLHLWR